MLRRLLSVASIIVAVSALWVPVFTRNHKAVLSMSAEDLVGSLPQPQSIFKNYSSYCQLPITLYRIQNKLQVSLQDDDSQMDKTRETSDLNGMSLQPLGENLIKSLENIVEDDTRIYRLHEGLVLPPNLILLHEHSINSDRYSLQTIEPIELTEFNNKSLVEFLMNHPSSSRDNLLEQFNDEDDQDN